jgi:hypothetical protein
MLTNWREYLERAGAVEDVEALRQGERTGQPPCGEAFVRVQEQGVVTAPQ